MLGLTPEEICAAHSLSAKYVGTQIFRWIWKGVTSFDEMTDLPQALRRHLGETASLRTGVVTAQLRDPEGTQKVRLEFPGAPVEAVLLSQFQDEEEAPRFTACLSSQSGCAMGCAFCKTGALGLRRNLTAAEMVEQFLRLEASAGQALDNLVFMGMGEPLANMAALRKCVALLSHPAGRALSLRRITVSTSGLIAPIVDLADHGPHLRLAVSLTAADAETREALMPVARQNPLGDLKAAIRYYGEKSGRRPTLEAALLSGVNTSASHAHAFAAFARDLGAHVNLIPWNPVAGIDFKAPGPAECRTFQGVLENAGLSVTLRMRRGAGIAGACGQLG